MKMNRKKKLFLGNVHFCRNAEKCNLTLIGTKKETDSRYSGSIKKCIQIFNCFFLSLYSYYNLCPHHSCFFNTYLFIYQFKTTIITGKFLKTTSQIYDQLIKNMNVLYSDGNNRECLIKCFLQNKKKGNTEPVSLKRTPRDFLSPLFFLRMHLLCFG